MDLFDQEDKRLSLKPVKEFADLVRNAFGDGRCTCVLCRDGGAGPAPKKPQHTLDLDGTLVCRRFAITAYSDVRGALSKAWESYYKTTLPDQGLVDMDAITVLVGDDALPRLLLLLLEAGVVAKNDEQELLFAAES